MPLISHPTTAYYTLNHRYGANVYTIKSNQILLMFLHKGFIDININIRWKYNWKAISKSNPSILSSQYNVTPKLYKMCYASNDRGLTKISPAFFQENQFLRKKYIYIYS